MKAQAQRTATTLVVVAMIVLLLLLIGLDVYPLFTGNDGYVIEQQAWLQIARDEFLAKDVLILEYRGTSYHSQAISDLQVILPQFQQTQNGFVHGDASLGLPAPGDDVERLLVRASDDYLPMITALQAMLKKPDGPVDPVQVNIVMAHEYSYSLVMAQVAIIEQQQAEATTVHLMIIKVILKSLFILVIGAHFVSIGKPILDRLVLQEEGT